uniref:hypothetical protein n=1 Tax=Gelidibacter sp. TaxID=2018083 RepID=UPI004049C221
MNKIKFRQNNPERTYSGAKKANYRKYKPFLQKDFNGRCGYTDCSQVWFGGSNSFHIDHFRPKSLHPHLTTEYSNLVYSCSYVNISKGDDDSDYLDPCDIDYNEHFFRDEFGNITPEPGSHKANYMFSKMKLYLKRYSVIFMLDNLREKMNLISETIKGMKDGADKNELLQLQGELSIEFLEYLKYLEIEQ